MSSFEHFKQKFNVVRSMGRKVDLFPLYEEAKELKRFAGSLPEHVTDQELIELRSETVLFAKSITKKIKAARRKK